MVISPPPQVIYLLKWKREAHVGEAGRQAEAGKAELPGLSNVIRPGCHTGREGTGYKPPVGSLGTGSSE